MADKILVLESDNFPILAVELLHKHDFTVEFWDGASSLDSFADVTILLVRLAYFIDQSFISHFPLLRTIVTPTTGITHIHSDVRESYNIVKIDPEDPFIGEITPTAEHAILLALMAQRNMKEIFRNIQSNFKRPSFTYGTMKGSKVLIVGNGRIGSHVERLISPFTQTVPDFYDKVEYLSSLKQDEMLTLLPNYDLVFLCIKYEGKIAISSDFINALADRVVLVNISRGEIIDEDAVLSRIQSSDAFFYCTDVLTDEHIVQRNNLFIKQAFHDNLILTPHVGGFCYKSLQYIEYEITKKLLSQNI